VPVSWITLVIHQNVRRLRYHVVFQQIWRYVRSDRPLRNVGRLISGGERTISRPSWRAGGGIRARLGSRRRALGPLVDVVVAAVTAVHFAGGLAPNQ
jgi:hypothetical protein